MKLTYNCIIVDDERFARDLIADYLKQYPEFNLIGKYKNTHLAKNALELDNSIDLIFLDIQMPNETGLEFLKNNLIQTNVIFTTAYSEYAIESYSLEVVDYLLKPISEQRFRQSIKKVLTHIQTKEKALAFELLEQTSSDYIVIKSGANNYKLHFKDLIRVEADGEYVSYITKTRKYLILASLKKIAKKLPSSFVQVHRSHIISELFIQGRENYSLILKDGSRIPIGKTYRTTILQHLKSIGFSQ